MMKLTAISFQYVKLLESTYIYDKVNCYELYYCKLLFGLFPKFILSFLFLRSKLAWRERERSLTDTFNRFQSMFAHCSNQLCIQKHQIIFNFGIPLFVVFTTEFMQRQHFKYIYGKIFESILHSTSCTFGK